MHSEKQTQRFFTAPLIIIYITVFIDLIGFGMVIPILPIYANTDPFHATPFQIGLLFSIYSWMQFVFSPILGRMSDTYGRRPILFFSLLGSAVGYFVMGAAGSLLMVFAGRIFGGITGGNIATAQAYVADVTSKENRAKGMGIFGAMFGLGFILGPAISGILSKYGVHVPFYFAAILSLFNAIALYFLLPETVQFGKTAVKKIRPNRIKELLNALSRRLFGTLIILNFLIITAFSIMTYAFVLFMAYRFGYNTEQIGYLFAYVGLIAVISQGVLFNRLVRFFGEMKLCTIGCALMVISLFITPMVGPAFGGLAAVLAVCALFSFGNACAAPSLTSLASKITPDEEQGSSLGIMQSSSSLARAIGPMVGGILLTNALQTLDDNTVTRTFWAASALMAIAFITSIFATMSAKKYQLEN